MPPPRPSAAPRLRGSVRARIAGSIFVVSTGLLVCMSVAVYVTFDRQLSTSLDDTLRLRAEANVQRVAVSTGSPSLRVETDPGGELAAGEAVLRLYGADGASLADASPASPASDEERALVAAVVAAGGSVYRTIDLDADEDYRELGDPVLAGGVVVGVLVTGLERSRVDDPLALLRLTLIVADALTAAALAFGSYWVVRRVLRPVAAMTETAERIVGGDLHQRIEGADGRDELGHLAATLNAMLGRLGATIDRERRFTADASHELRTPLSAIEAGIDVTLAQERSPDEYRRVLAVVRGQSRRLHALADSLLLLARLDDQALRGRFEPVELSGLVEAAVESFLSRHPEATVEVGGAPGPMEVLGDVELLGRAVLNLLENAATHVGPAVRVTVELGREAGGAVTVAVEDDGPGIPDALASEVFRRFRRGDASRGGAGMGLGLAIVEAVARAHGGSVGVAPARDGQGARFRLVIPPVV